jgi:histidine decarboxylase
VTHSYLHADAALSGMILPFVPEPQPYGFDAGIDSIAVSGHKLIGAPLPCGVVLTRRANVERVGRTIELVGIQDTTLSGSRNGLTPLMLWYALNRYGIQGFRELVTGMLDTAEYAVERFNRHGITAWRHPNSVTVVFPKPAPEVLQKWQIASEGDIVHIITMPHVTRDQVDELIADCHR